MNQTWLNYLRNLPRQNQTGALLEPIAATYYLTHRCNLSCAYCEDFGLARNIQNAGHEPTSTALAVLARIREACDSLILTGGEALLHPGLDEILHHARHQLKFREITILTNGILLQQKQQILPYLDRLVISFDTLDLDIWSNMIGASRKRAEKILAAITWAASRQKIDRFALVLNCVLSPAGLAGARSLLEFCTTHGILISFSPQSVQNWPAYELVTDPAYPAFVKELISQKKEGAPILGSSTYLRTLSSMEPYACHPTLIPRVMPDGALIYPCRPIERAGGQRGGHSVNLLTAGSWKEAIRQSADRYGLLPETCASCFQQCYAEASLMQDHPLALLAEMIQFPSSRRGSLITHAPG